MLFKVLPLLEIKTHAKILQTTHRWVIDSIVYVFRLQSLLAMRALALKEVSFYQSKSVGFFEASSYLSASDKPSVSSLRFF